MELGIIAIIISIMIALFPYVRNRYFLGPELTIEIIPNGGNSLSRGLSSKNKVNADGHIDGNNAIEIFELSWEFRVIIRNNSDNTAYYPKILFISSKPKFTKIDSLNELNPIVNTDSIELKAEYSKFEECQGKDITTTTGIPDELKNLKILIESRNGKKMKFYTLYCVEKNKNQFIRKIPKEFK